jgi:hypothetical protein
MITSTNQARLLMNTALRDAIGASGTVKFYTRSSTLLVEVPLAPGTVGSDGRLHLTASGDGTAVSSGSAHVAHICASNGDVLIIADVKGGAVPESGYMVVEDTDIDMGYTLSVDTFTLW